MEVGIRERKEFPNERVGDVGLRSYYGGIIIVIIVEH